MTDFKEIFPDADYCKLHRSGNKVTISIGAMYGPPEVTFKQLLRLSEIFGTDQITTDRFDYGGCETCDYGSDYGYEIYIMEANDTDISGGWGNK